MGGACSNTGKVMKNKEESYYGHDPQDSSSEKHQKYRNLNDGKTTSNTSNSRKGSFSESVLESMKNMPGNRPEKAARQITMKQLSKHNNEKSAWTSFRGVVYDVTKYLKIHPGGLKKLLRGCGKECDMLIEIYHRNVKVDEMFKNDVVGYLVKEDQPNQGKENQNKN